MESMSSDCRGVSVCYPAGLSLSPELGCRLRLETGFISLLADLSMKPAGPHIRFLSPVREMARESVSAPHSWLIILSSECPLQPSCLKAGLQLMAIFSLSIMVNLQIIFPIGR